MRGGRFWDGGSAAGASALTFRNSKREEREDTRYIRQEIWMISCLRYLLALCLRHKARSSLSSRLLQRTVERLRCRRSAVPETSSPASRPVPFHWDTSPFTGIRPLSSGYVPFHWATSPFIGLRPLSSGYVPFHRATSPFAGIRPFWRCYICLRTILYSSPQR